MNQHATAVYTPPAIRDHGTLVALTADFDLHVAGSVVRLATLAMASAPGGAFFAGETASSAGPVAAGAPSRSPFAAVGDLVTPEARPRAGEAAVLGDRAIADPGVAGGADPGAAAVAGEDAAAGATREELPFTGYAASVVAMIGAMLTLSGAALRSMLRRSRP